MATSFVSNKLLALLGLAVWWGLLIAFWMGQVGLIFVFAAIVLLVVISLRFRAHPQIVSVWIPVTALMGLSTLSAALYALLALSVFIGYRPQDLFGALNSIVFVLIAIPIAITGVVTAVITFFSFKYRPKIFPQPLSSISTLNTLALFAFIAVYHQTVSIVARDPMIIHVLDSQDRAVSQVTIHYANYTTQANGATEPKPEESGTVMTDEKGDAQLSPDYLARHVVLDFNKDGFAKITAILENNDVGEGDQGFREIHIQFANQAQIDGTKADAAQTYVSNKHPIEMKLYLPTEKEAPLPEQQLNFGGLWPSTGVIYLKLCDGSLTETPSGDIKFEVFENGLPDAPTNHFMVTALNGANLTPYRSLRADFANGLKNEHFKFDDMINLAPLDEYDDKLMLSEDDREFYYRSQDGKQYARIELRGLGSYHSPYKRGPKGKIYLWTVNPR